MSRLQSDLPQLRWLTRAAPNARMLVALLTLVRMGQGMIGVGYAVCLRAVVDAAVSGRSGVFYRSVGLFVCLLLLQFFLLMASRYLSELTASGIENQLKLRLMHQLLHRSYGQVTAVHSGEWMNRLTSDTVVVAGAAAAILPGAAGMIAKLLSAGITLLILVPKLALAFLLFGLLAMCSTIWMRRVMKRLHRQIQEKDGLLRIFLTERLSSLLILKAYQQEDAAEQHAAGLMDDHRQARMRKNHFSNLCNSGFYLAMNGAYLLGVLWCGLGILHGTLSYGTFLAVSQLVNQLSSPITGLTGFIPQYYSMLASIERLMEAENFSCCEPQPVSGEELRNFSGLKLSHVSFSYPDEPDRRDAISDLSMELSAGQYTALTGPSGCGKSTVLKLLLGLFEPDSGCCQVISGGRTYVLSTAWNRLFAYVPQGNHLMRGTIREVLSLACPEKRSDDAALWQALRISCAEEFVRALPQGLDTLLGERGGGLSEGQMQRLAVARALLSDRPVLLLDEATSALDEDSEITLLRNLRAMTGKTVLFVTHRPAALEVVDQIIRFPEKQ